MITEQIISLLQLNKVRVREHGYKGYSLLQRGYDDARFTLILRCDAGIFRKKYSLYDLDSKMVVCDDQKALKEFYNTIQNYMNTCAEDRLDLTKNTIRQTINNELDKIIYTDYEKP
jgi:hypothetical protein